MMLKQLIEELNHELQMEPSEKTKEEHCYSLAFDGDIHLKVFDFSPYFLIKGEIGPCPKDHLDAFFLQSMEANLFGVGTRGATIGWKEKENLLTLSVELDYNSSYKDFKEKLEDFVSMISFWREEANKQ
jgi:hypothetical protein